MAYIIIGIEIKELYNITKLIDLPKMKQTIGMGIAVMALLGEATTIDVKKHYNNEARQDKELMQLQDEEEDDDAFMKESIKEAEAEYKKK